LKLPSILRLIKGVKNIELSIALIDLVNNKPLSEGSAVYAGDTVLMGIKAQSKG
jgi:hypothetical protein